MSIHWFNLFDEIREEANYCWSKCIWALLVCQSMIIAFSCIIHRFSQEIKIWVSKFWWVLFFICGLCGQILLLVVDEVERCRNGYYVVVGGITPTPLGKGKSTTTVRLCQALGAFLCSFFSFFLYFYFFLLSGRPNLDVICFFVWYLKTIKSIFNILNGSWWSTLKKCCFEYYFGKNSPSKVHQDGLLV